MKKGAIFDMDGLLFDTEKYLMIFGINFLINIIAS